MSYKQYRNDPHWITVRYAGKCSKCAAIIAKGSEAYYYPSTKTLLGKACGCAGQAEADFESHVFDELNCCW